MQRFHVRTLAPLAAFATVLAACDGGGTSVPTPAAVTPTTTVNQQSTPGATAEPPAVRVVDAGGQPIPGVGVTFAVTGGGGTIGSPLATTDSAGVASATSWTLGPSLGVNTVTATVTGLPVVTFTATAQDPCTVAAPYTLSGTVQGTLSSVDCRLDSGEFLDIFQTTLGSARGLTFTMTSSAFNPLLVLFDSDEGSPVAVEIDDPSSSSLVRIFAPQGTYGIVATSSMAGATGSYSLTSSDLAGNVECQLPWVVPGVAITGEVLATDCAFDGYYSDVYPIFLQPGERLTLRMESAALDAYLILFQADGTVVASDDDTGGGLDATLTYAASEFSLLLIDAGTALPGETGAYTLSVTSAGGTASIGPGAAPRLSLSRDELLASRGRVLAARAGKDAPR